MSRAEETVQTTVTVVVPAAGQPLAQAWRDGTVGCDTPFVAWCAQSDGLRTHAVAMLLEAARNADAVLGTATSGPVALLVRTSDVAAAALLRIRGDSDEAVREVEANLLASGLRVRRVALADLYPRPAAASNGPVRLVARSVAVRLVDAGHAVGLCSRSTRNLEIWRARATGSSNEMVPPCPACGAPATAQTPLPLWTSADMRDRGDAQALLCEQCEVARTFPLPVESARVITPDIERETMSTGQRLLLRWFIRERVARVRALLPTERRARVADIGGGACAFANALAARGCDVTVFEPNAANREFADEGAGVRFVAAPFHEGAVRDADIAAASLDAITMWHALEHVPNPMETLKLARRLLRPGGVLYVCVPNLDSLQADVAGTLWAYADIPRHVSQFTPEGLDRQMRRAGFGAIAPRWWSAEYEIFGWYQSLLNLMTGSHNYFYNRAKKGRSADAGPRPWWTRAAATAGPLLLPVALALSWLGSASSKPSCVEMHGVAQ
ncbi:MAG: class I SAM-dependent methyltransferase [Gemmatimonadetes bacterium]|nr:class I SAM-dependent methyltransferase [Gemmatimonadota bacterium]